MRRVQAVNLWDWINHLKVLLLFAVHLRTKSYHQLLFFHTSPPYKNLITSVMQNLFQHLHYMTLLNILLGRPVLYEEEK